MRSFKVGQMPSEIPPTKKWSGRTSEYNALFDDLKSKTATLTNGAAWPVYADSVRDATAILAALKAVAASRGDDTMEFKLRGANVYAKRKQG